MIMHQSKTFPAKSKPVGRIVPVGFQPKHRRGVRLAIDYGYFSGRNPPAKVFHCKTGKLLYVGRTVDAQLWCWATGFPIMEI